MSLAQVLAVGQKVVFEYQGFTYRMEASNILLLDEASGEQVSEQRGILTESTACVYIPASGASLWNSESASHSNLKKLGLLTFSSWQCTALGPSLQTDVRHKCTFLAVRGCWIIIE